MKYLRVFSVCLAVLLLAGSPAEAVKLQIEPESGIARDAEAVVAELGLPRGRGRRPSARACAMP